MKLKFFSIVTAVIVCLCFSSCSKDPAEEWEKKDKQENKIVCIVSSNSPDVPMYFSGVKDGGITIKDYYKGELTTNAWQFTFDVYCDDPTVLITMEVYVNGKLWEKSEGNSHTKILVILKS